MFNTRLITSFFLILMLLAAEDTYAQLNRNKVKKNNRQASNFRGRKQGFTKQKQYQMIGFSVNALNYFGDITPASGALSSDISFTRPGFSVWAGHRFQPRLTVEAALSWGTFSATDFSSADPSGDDVFRYIRNLSFRNRITELSATVVADIHENNASYLSRLNLTFYGFAGISVFHHNPQALVSEDSSLPEAGQWVNLKPLGTEGQNSDLYNRETYKNIQLAIPFGIGARYRFNQVIDFSFQVGIRYLFFDYIDDVSTSYVDLGALDSDLARELSDRSRELNAGRKNEPRDFTIIDQFARDQTYVGVDGNTYTVYTGYGSDTHPSNIRGNVDDRDWLLYTQIRVSYIIGGAFRGAKYR